MKRREFIAIGGAGVAAALAPDVAYKAYWTLYEGKDYWNDWIEVPRLDPIGYVPTVCQQCPGGCGVLIRKSGERAIKVEGNPAHPISRGGVCPKGSTALQVHYHPERVKTPLKRVGERGSGQWQSISWDEAIETVVNELRTIRTSGPQGVAFLDGEESGGLMKVLINRFLTAYGSPNYIEKPSSQGDELLMKSAQLDGTEGFYDLSKAKYIISFGMNFLEAFYSPLQGIQAYSNLRKVRTNEFVYVGSRRSVTGIKADEWVAANPGTEGLLAIGIARVLIEKALYNKAYVDGRTSGFSEYESAVMRHSLHDIAHETGVSEETIEELAKSFAERGDMAVAIGNSGTVADQVAINNLNLLTGSFAKLWWSKNEDAIPYTELAEVDLDGTAQAGISQQVIVRDFNLKKQVFGTLSDNLANGNPYPVKALFIYYSNPILSVPNTQKVRKALESVPFIVNFSPFLDETAQISDIILPDNSPLEKWQDAPQFMIDGTPVLGLRQPVVEKRHDTMQTGDVLLAIASKFGAPLSEALPWGVFRSFVLDSLKGVYESNTGNIVGGGFPADFDSWVEALAKSAWRNPNGKMGVSEIVGFNSDFVSRVRSHAEHTEGEFHLNVYKLMSLTKPRNTAQPTLFDIAAPHIYRKWVAWVEINAETAHEHHIEDEDWVWVESGLGREKFKAKLTEGVVPEAVNIPLNIGAKGYGFWEKKIWPEQNPLAIVEDKLDSLDGHYLYDTKVKIHKV
jgi:anaerobic selenocysteine-containing dehydrogenase